MPRKNRSYHELYLEHLAEIEKAEHLGFDHYWIYEHHLLPLAPMPSPNLMLAAAAIRTRRIRLGNMVNVVPFRNPLMVAEEAAMLDVLSNGRLDLGLGRGSNLSEYRAFGIPMDQSRPIFEQHVDVILRALADENFSVSGKLYNISKQAALSPPPIQKPHPPVYVTAASQESLRWAAERDLPFVQLDSLIEDCARDLAYYREIQAESGHKHTSRLCLTREIYVGETDEAARKEAYSYLLEYWGLWGRYAQFVAEAGTPGSFETWYQRAPRLAAMNFDELIESGLVLVGSPQTVARKIVEHQNQLDIAVLVGVFQLGSLPHEKVVKSMEAFAKEVMPMLARMAAPKILSSEVAAYAT
jgi:alkanesulfonate monooxygenase SsuD/methylene tetrahydromethanopterin reductase-like flavin-dependent oxidoreductase (luciferase family)